MFFDNDKIMIIKRRIFFLDTENIFFFRYRTIYFVLCNDTYDNDDDEFDNLPSFKKLRCFLGDLFGQVVLRSCAVNVLIG